MNKKKYLSPTMKVVEVNAQQIICASNGSFTLSSSNVEEGSEEVWSSTNLNW